MVECRRRVRMHTVPVGAIPCVESQRNRVAGGSRPHIKLPSMRSGQVRQRSSRKPRVSIRRRLGATLVAVRTMLTARLAQIRHRVRWAMPATEVATQPLRTGVFFLVRWSAVVQRVRAGAVRRHAWPRFLQGLFAPGNIKTQRPPQAVSTVRVDTSRLRRPRTTWPPPPAARYHAPAATLAATAPRGIAVILAALASIARVHTQTAAPQTHLCA